MKQLCLFILFVPLLLTSEQSVDAIDRTAELLKNGNIRELADNFSPNIEMTVLQDDDVYSGTQAEQALAAFFKRCPPRSVKVLHRITSNVNYRIAVVLLGTSNGNYRTVFSLKNINGKYEMSELHIEAEKTK